MIAYERFVVETRAIRRPTRLVETFPTTYRTCPYDDTMGRSVTLFPGRFEWNREICASLRNSDRSCGRPAGRLSVDISGTGEPIRTIFTASDAEYRLVRAQRVGSRPRDSPRSYRATTESASIRCDFRRVREVPGDEAIVGSLRNSARMRSRDPSRDSHTFDRLAKSGDILKKHEIGKKNTDPNFQTNSMPDERPAPGEATQRVIAQSDEN